MSAKRGRYVRSSGFQLTDSLRPGEVVICVDAHDPSSISGEKVADRKVIPVTVPLYTDELRRT